MGLNDWIGVYEWVKVLFCFVFLSLSFIFVDQVILRLQQTKVLWVMQMFFVLISAFCLCVCFCLSFLNICNTVIHVWWEYECCNVFFFVCMRVCVQASKEIIKPSSVCGCESFFLSLGWFGPPLWANLTPVSILSFLSFIWPSPFICWIKECRGLWVILF